MSLSTANEEQLEFWDGPDGTHWAEHEERYNAAMTRYAREFFDSARIETADNVLDIGCGSGETSRQAAKIASGGRVLGLDLSSAMLDLARRRAKEEHLSNVTFEQADAQTYTFAGERFDCAISRVGAMFFGDPSAAFANIRGALLPGGRLTLLVWQGLEGNEWLGALREALALERALPTPPVSVPGPFGLADPEFGREVLGAAGFGDIQLKPVAQPFKFGTDVDNAYDFVTSLGFTRGMLEPLSSEEKGRALQQLREVMVAHDEGDGVWFGSSAWLITATNP